MPSVLQLSAMATQMLVISPVLSLISALVRRVLPEFLFGFGILVSYVNTSCTLIWGVCVYFGFIVGDSFYGFCYSLSR